MYRENENRGIKKWGNRDTTRMMFLLTTTRARHLTLFVHRRCLTPQILSIYTSTVIVLFSLVKEGENTAISICCTSYRTQCSSWS